MRLRGRQIASYVAVAGALAFAGAPVSLGATLNQAEGAANRLSDYDCNHMGFFWRCHEIELSDCKPTGANEYGVPQWVCTEVFSQQNWVFPWVFRVKGRNLFYGPALGLIATSAWVTIS